MTKKSTFAKCQSEAAVPSTFDGTISGEVGDLERSNDGSEILAIQNRKKKKIDSFFDFFFDVFVNFSFVSFFRKFFEK